MIQASNAKRIICICFFVMWCLPRRKSKTFFVINKYKSGIIGNKCLSPMFRLPVMLRYE